MANRNFDITFVADGVSRQTILPVRAYKGIVDVKFNFSFTSAGYETVKLKVVFDNKPATLYERGSIPSTLSYTLLPATDDFIAQRYIQITAIYNNFSTHAVVIPVYVAQPSYFSNFQGLKVKSAQFIDTTDNGDLFVVLETADHNIHHIVLKSNQIDPATIPTRDVSVLAALSANNIDINPIVTNFDDNIEVIDEP